MWAEGNPRMVSPAATMAAAACHGSARRRVCEAQVGRGRDEVGAARGGAADDDGVVHLPTLRAVAHKLGPWWI